MIIQVLKLIFLASALGVLQVSFIPSLGWPFDAINLVIIFLSFLSVFGRFERTIVYTFTLGLVLDLFSSWFFPAQTVALLITVFVVHKVFVTFFTNKSLYSIALITGISTILYHYLLNLSAFMTWLVRQGVFDSSLLYTVSDARLLLRQLIVNISTGIVFYLVYYFLSNKFQSVVLRKS